VINDDERIALFLDYENLAIGARDGLGVSPFDFGPIADALAERAAWSRGARTPTGRTSTKTAGC
jgi:hypothetical protein